MNHRDRETLGVILDQLWESRNGRSGQMVGTLNQPQRDLIAAAMRIVAGTEGPNLPDPWPVGEGWNLAAKFGPTRPEYTDPRPPRYRRILNRIDRHIGPLIWRNYR